jgi:hypothetical protein
MTEKEELAKIILNDPKIIEGDKIEWQDIFDSIKTITMFYVEDEFDEEETPSFHTTLTIEGIPHQQSFHKTAFDVGIFYQAEWDQEIRNSHLKVFLADRLFEQYSGQILR